MSRAIHLPHPNRRRSVLGSAVVLVVLLIVAACAQPQIAPSLSSSKANGVPAAAPTVSAAAAAPGVAQRSSSAPQAQAQPTAAAASPPNAVAPAAQSSSAASSAAQTSVPPLDRMVIRTAQLTIEVPGDMEQAIASARDIAQRGGGYVSASNTHRERVDNQDRTVADLTLQVRSDSADETLSALRGLGNVVDETSGSQDVTEEFVDVDSNLRNLQASESAVLKLMDQATRIDDVLSLERELTSIRGQIERLQGRKNYLQNRSDMATITVSLRVPGASSSESTASASGWNPLQIAQQGWQASLSVLRRVADVVILVAAFSWWLLPVVVLGGYVWQRRRRSIAQAGGAAQ